MTRKLFWEDPYMSRFQAQVTGVENNKLVLDQTCFYPEGGGQVGDRGRIEGIRVNDTQKEGQTIKHVLERETDSEIGEQVSCELDWERRYKIMKLHSASHVMEHFLFKVFGPLKLIGTHVNEKHDKSTYLVEGMLDSDKLSEVSDLVNEFLARNLKIKVFSSQDDPNYRFWECGEIMIPCGGTHPKNTSEIGLVRIRRKSGGRGKETVITTLSDR